jgi:hypothetical protein
MIDCPSVPRSARRQQDSLVLVARLGSRAEKGLPLARSHPHLASPASERARDRQAPVSPLTGRHFPSPDRSQDYGEDEGDGLCSASRKCWNKVSLAVISCPIAAIILRDISAVASLPTRNTDESS